MRCLRRHLQITFHRAAEAGQEGKTYLTSSANEEKGKTNSFVCSVQHLWQHSSWSIALSHQVYPDILCVYAVFAPCSATFWLSLSSAFLLHADVWEAFILVIQKELFCIKSSWQPILASLWERKKEEPGFSTCCLWTSPHYSSFIRPKGTHTKIPLWKYL